MNKTALLAVGVFAVLLAAVFLLNREDAGPPSEGLVLPGFVERESAVVKTVTELADHGFDKIELTRRGVSATFERRAGKWVMTSPRTARLDQNRIKTILLPHQRPLSSIFSGAFTEESAGDYGLDDKTRVGVTLYREGAVFAAYEVGDSARSDDPEAGADEVDTWVRRPGEDRVHRIAGADLRRAVDLDLDDFRDKKLFGVERHELAWVEIDNPAAAPHARIRLDNRAEPAPADDDGGEGAGAKGEGQDPAGQEKEKWHISEPKGYRPGAGITSFLTTLVGTRASAFLSGDALKGLDTGLDGAEVVTLRLQPREGELAVLRVAIPEGQKAYAQLDGTDEVIELSSYAAKAIVKTVDDLRDKKVLELAPGDVTGFRFPAFDMDRTTDGWQVTRPAGVVTSQKVADALLRDLESFSITEFVKDPDPAALGFGDAGSLERVRIVHSGGELALEITPEADGFFYFRRADDPSSEVWKVSSYMGKKFSGKTVDDARNREVFSVGKKQIQRIELVFADETTTLERGEGDTWTARRGADSKEGLRDGAVGTLVNTLGSLAVRDFAHDKAPEAVGLGADAFRARVISKAGSTHELVLSEQTGEEDAVYATAPSEDQFRGRVFTLNPYQAKSLRKRFADL